MAARAVWGGGGEVCGGTRRATVIFYGKTTASKFESGDVCQKEHKSPQGTDGKSLNFFEGLYSSVLKGGG